MIAYPEPWARLQPGPLLDEHGQPVLDPYSGEPTIGWDTPTATPLQGCFSAPVSSTEAPTVDRETLRTLRTLYCPYGTTVDPTDRLRDGVGDVWQVEGYPEHWRHPMTGWEAGTVVALKRMEG